MVWHKVSEGLPTEEKEYLCYREFSNGSGYYSLLNFARNLYEVDKYDFYDKKNILGFYDFDSEYGYIYKTPDYWADFERIK